MFDPLPFEISLATRWVGHPLLFLREVDSTNRLLRELAHEGAAGGTVVVTNHQRAGRGRQGREWVTPPGSSLLQSILLRPLALTERHALLPILVAVAVARTLEKQLGLVPQIKWPNDLLLDGRKCCGILLESEWGGGAPLVVAGIGLNVNQEAASFEGLPDATSLRLALGAEVERGPLLARLLGEVEQAYDAFEAGWNPREAWCERAAFLGQPIRVQPRQGEAWAATARGLAADGGLLVERKDGTSEILHAGDVSVRPYPEHRT